MLNIANCSVECEQGKVIGVYSFRRYFSDGRSFTFVNTACLACSVLLLLVSSVVVAEKIVVFNNSTVGLEYKRADGRTILASSQQYLVFNAGVTVWLNFGAIAHQYDFSDIANCHKFKGSIWLQANNSGKLYCVSGYRQKKRQLPVGKPGKQPKKFPLSAVNIVDLT